MRRMNVIRSHQHGLFTETVNKVALSADGDERFIREDGNHPEIHTYAHSHYKLKLNDLK